MKMSLTDTLRELVKEAGCPEESVERSVKLLSQAVGAVEGYHRSDSSRPSRRLTQSQILERLSKLHHALKGVENNEAGVFFTYAYRPQPSSIPVSGGVVLVEASDSIEVSDLIEAARKAEVAAQKRVKRAAGAPSRSHGWGCDELIDAFLVTETKRFGCKWTNDALIQALHRLSDRRFLPSEALPQTKRALQAAIERRRRDVEGVVPAD